MSAHFEPVRHPQAEMWAPPCTPPPGRWPGHPPLIISDKWARNVPPGPLVTDVARSGLEGQYGVERRRGLGTPDFREAYLLEQRLVFAEGSLFALGVEQ